MEYHTPHKTVIMKIAGKSAGSLVLDYTHVPLVISQHYTLSAKVTFFAFCLSNSVISFRFTSPLNPSLSLKSQFFPFFKAKCEQSE